MIDRELNVVHGFFMSDLYYYSSPVGTLRIQGSHESIIGIHFSKESKKRSVKVPSAVQKLFKQLDEYFQGKRTEFDLPFEFVKGTPFQKKVWKALTTIPYGQTVSYKQIAQKVGSPKAFRAVGMANNKNPISIVVPCHRVIGANGQLVGYGGGLNHKKTLLTLESQ